MVADTEPNQVQGAEVRRSVAGPGSRAPLAGKGRGRMPFREPRRVTTAAAPQTGVPHTVESVIARLEEAGQTLLCLPISGNRPEVRLSRWPAVHSAIDAYGWSGNRLRPAVPPAAAISRMDETLGWIGLIPKENYVLRRIVGARTLVSPLTGRYLFSWRRLGSLLGADARAVKRWHTKGIAVICDGLNGETRC